MLIEFSVTNFKSIQTTQTLSMVASSTSELKEQNSFITNEQAMPRLLRSVAIYGPNASGKTNLLQAIDFMESFVTQSSKEGQEGEPIDVKPFLFNEVVAVNQVNLRCCSCRKGFGTSMDLPSTVRV